MPENKKARNKRKRKNKNRAIRKGEFDLARRDYEAFAASFRRRRAAGGHGEGRPDKEESRNACRGRIHAEDYLDEE